MPRSFAAMHSDYLQPDSDLPLITRLSETHPRARKEYKCLVCGQPIRVGEKHQKFVCIDEDSLDKNKFRSFRSHIFCPEPEL